MPLTSQRTGTDRRAELLAPALLPLFDDGFIASWDMFEEYMGRLAASILARSGLERAFRVASTVPEAVAHAGLSASLANVPVQWLAATLCERGAMTCIRYESGQTRYQLSTGFTVEDAQEIAQRQEQHDARCLPAYAIAALAADHYPSVMKGQMTGEQALFGPDGISAWAKYFSNSNPLYAVSNQVGAIAAAQSFEGGAILELGGGLGSGAQALLERLHEAGRRIVRYRFTELSPLFMKRAERVLGRWREQCGLEFSHLDIDRSFAEASVARAAHALVYAVNVLHVAHDLAATLREIRDALAPGGSLVISECIRPFAGMALPVELVFNLLESFREPLLHPVYRPNGGFLTPEQWTHALQANGFADVRVFPNIAALREDYPSFAIAAIVARRD